MQAMSRREFMKSTAVGAAALSADAAMSAELGAAAARPNVLFIMTDQQRFDAIRYVQDALPDYADRAKIHTPNLDRLLRDGVYFSDAYSPCAVCAPCRAVLRTGYTLERCGVQANELARYDYYMRSAQFRDKINRAETFEQILVEECGYQAAYFGKWHLPDRFKFKRAYTRKDDGKGTHRSNVFCATDNPEERVIRFNDVDWKTGALSYSHAPEYPSDLKEVMEARRARGESVPSTDCSDAVRPGFGAQYINSYSGYPYDSVAIDSRNTEGLPAGTPPPKALNSQPNHVGRDCLDEELTPSYFTAEAARLAIRQFAQEKAPFVVTASFHNPHAPMIATGTFFDRYWAQREALFVAPSHKDAMAKSDYRGANGRASLLKNGLRYDEPAAIQEWTAAYYALCEEIDHHIGRLLDELDAQGVAENTMVIFLSDHGEMLGAHGMREKNIFLEESAHIPLFVRFPGRIPPGSTVRTPVSLIDVCATILDYCGASRHDRSDGKSLRRHIERASWNPDYDDEAIVAEWDFRSPSEDGQTLSRSFGGVPNFLCRKGPWKLMVTKKADSPLHDMLYSLEHDPYEVSNLIYAHGAATWISQEEMIGKAEHLKALLVDWMIRMDGSGRYYSDPKYNNGEGRGDLEEVRMRRKWAAVDFWVSDRKVRVGPLARVDGRYRKKVWIYFGTTTPGDIGIESVTVDGPADELGLQGFTKGNIASGRYQKVALCYSSATPEAAKARLSIRYRKGGERAEAIVELA